ncbi:MAG TPA: sulfotransferase domain-containing protein [Longimicrobiales bacterium]|nr:sulfotransferase domain-containing protein [Longimicrobiales bacterium]
MAGHRFSRGEDTVPNFFIIGAARSGTTALWSQLAGHPEVFMPPNLLHKEPAYFSDLKGRWCTWREYLGLFRGAPTGVMAVGEASTAYLTDPSTPPRLAEFRPDAKLIAILRNPVDRAYSLYHWMTSEGYEYAPTFESALRLEARRAADERFRWHNPEYFYNYMYLGSGRYGEQIERWFRHFPRHQLLILVFEEAMADPLRAYQEVCRFLGVSTDVLPGTPVRNASRVAAFPPFQYVLRHVVRRLPRTRRGRFATKEERDALLALGTLDRRPSPLAPERRAELLRCFESDIEQLAELTGIDFPARWLN